MTENNDSGSAAQTQRDPPPNVINTENVEATVQSQGVHWDDQQDGEVRAEHWSGNVKIYLALPDGTETDASASAYYDSETARDLANAFRENRAGTWKTEDCSKWLDRGWLYHEGPHRGDGDHHATVSLTPDGNHTRIELQYEGEKDDSTVTVTTRLSAEDRNAVAAALDYSAEQADDYEPPTHTATDTESRLR